MMKMDELELAAKLLTLAGLPAKVYYECLAIESTKGTCWAYLPLRGTKIYFNSYANPITDFADPNFKNVVERMIKARLHCNSFNCKTCPIRVECQGERK